MLGECKGAWVNARVLVGMLGCSMESKGAGGMTGRLVECQGGRLNAKVLGGLLL